MVSFIVIGVVLVFLIILFWTCMILFVASGNCKVIVKEDSLSGRKKTTHFGKFIEVGDPPTKKIQLDNKTKDTIPDWSEYFDHDEKMPVLEVYKDSNGDYHPIRFKGFDVEKNEIVKVADQKNMKFWFANETRARIEAMKKRSVFMDKILPAIFVIVAGFIFFFSLYYSNSNLNKAAETTKEYLSGDIHKQEVNITAETKGVLEKLLPVLQRLSPVQGGSYAEIRNG